jgi:hypothetical protein
MVPPDEWVVASGTLPPGLAITDADPTDLQAELTGTPTTGGLYVFTVKAKVSGAVVAEGEFTIFIGARMGVTASPFWETLWSYGYGSVVYGSFGGELVWVPALWDPFARPPGDPIYRLFEPNVGMPCYGNLYPTYPGPVAAGYVYAPDVYDLIGRDYGSLFAVGSQDAGLKTLTIEWDTTIHGTPDHSLTWIRQWTKNSSGIPGVYSQVPWDGPSVPAELTIPPNVLI